MGNEFFAYAGIAAIGTTVATCWSQFRAFFVRLSTYLVVQIKVSERGGGMGPVALKSYLAANFRKSPFGVRVFGGWSEFVRPRDKRMLVAYEMTEGGNFFWRGWRPVWVSSGGDNNNNQNSGMGSPGGGQLNVSFLRGTFDAEKMVAEAMDLYNARYPDPGGDLESTFDRFTINYVFGRGNRDNKRNGGEEASEAPMGMKSVRAADPEDASLRPLKWRKEDLGPPLSPSKRPTELLVLSPDVQEAVDEAIFWKRSRQFYKDRSIPWKRGWLLHGRPGTGKTSLARAVAQELNMPVWVFDLASLTNEELRDGWRRMANQTPCMALLEDIDGTFDGRTNVAVEGKNREGLTFDALLNCIDGVERIDGILVVVTTNKLEKVDSAIGVLQDDGSSSRPGRIDRIIEMKEPSREGLLVVAKRILDKRPDLWESLADEGFAKKETVCQFQEKCARLALKQRWENFKLTRLRKDFNRQPEVLRNQSISQEVTRQKALLSSTKRAQGLGRALKATFDVDG